MAKQPKIRFKGFTEEWKEAPLGQLVKEHRVSNQFVHHQNLLSLSYGKIVRRDIHANKGLLPASFDTYQIIDKDTIVFRVTDLQNDKRSLRVAISGEEGIISPAYVCVDVTSDEITASLLHKILHYHDVITKIYYKMGDGMRQTLNFHDLQELKLNYPNNEKEQKAIADIFNSIDATVTSKEAELEKLKNIKRALLEKLFPQDGQSIPAIRFKGFEGKWENRRLKDIATRVTRKNIGLESTLPLCISAQLGLVSQTEYYNNVVVGANLANYFLIKKGEFAYNKSAAGEYPMGAVKCLKSLDKGILSTLYIVFALKDDIDADYVQAHYETKPWQDDVKKRVAVGARNHGLLNISPEDFFDSLVVIPHNNDEQKKVGQILAKLSQTISLRERQLTLLKHSKQALLEQMFIYE